MRKLVFLVGTVLCTGCGAPANSPEGAVENFFKALKRGDHVKASQYVNETYGGLEVLDAAFKSLETRSFMQQIWAKTDYDVGQQEEVRGGAIIVPVRVSSPDLLAIIGAASNFSFNSPSMEEVRLRLEAEDAPTRQATLQINVSQVDGRWKLWPSPELDAALVGGTPALQ